MTATILPTIAEDIYFAVTHLFSVLLCALFSGQQCGEMVLALGSLLLPLGVPMDIRPFLTAEVRGRVG